MYIVLRSYANVQKKGFIAAMYRNEIVTIKRMFTKVEIVIFDKKLHQLFYLNSVLVYSTVCFIFVF